MIGVRGVGGRQGLRSDDPHSYFKTHTEAVGVSGNIRERLWVIRQGSGDWHAFGGRDDIYHFTSSDGVAWSKDSANPVAADSNRQMQDLCCFQDPWADRYLIIAEDEDNDSAVIWSAPSLDADSWTFEDEFTRHFGNAEFGPRNPAPWYDAASDTLYLYHEEWQKDNPEYTRVISTTADPATASNWSDEGRPIPHENYVPKGIWQQDGEPRWTIFQRNNVIDRYWVFKKDSGLLDLTAESVMWVAPPHEAGYGELTPPHKPNGIEEYYPEGEDRPWAYGWDNMGSNATNNYDLLKGKD